jgi:hypothetical protein
MTWGLGAWGHSPWGGIGAVPPASLISVMSFPGPTAEPANPAVVDENGGTICLLIGSAFSDPMEIEILIGSSPTYTVVGTGYIFDPRYDLERNRCYFGAPALERGLYHVRAITSGGPSGVLENVIAARRFADEFKTVSVRGKFSSKWATGPRILRG